MNKDFIPMQSVNDQVIQDWKFKHGTIFRFESEDGKVGYFKKPRPQDNGCRERHLQKQPG